jgi:hypothetical protein
MSLAFFFPGKVLYQGNDFPTPYGYIFTATDAAKYAIGAAPPYCPALYGEVCSRVGDLPPYSCSRKVYPTVFTVLGTAFANATFLLSVLCFIFGLVLTRMAKWYPPVGANIHRTGSAEDKNVRDIASLGQDIEMSTVHATENPLSQRV